MFGTSCSNNQGEDTTCPDFLKMSPSARHDVIEKMGYNASLVTNAHQASVALRLCRHAPRDETVGDALGP